MKRAPTAWLDAMRSYTAALDGFDLVARLTLIVLLLRSAAVWYVQIPLIPLCAAGILFPRLYRRSTFWFVISAVLAIAYVRNWFAIDNHDYLLGYLCLAIAMARTGDDPDRVLVLNARLLLGLTFLFAVVWRVVSPEFLSGDFFHFAFLTNTRFEWLATSFGNLNGSELAANRSALASVLASPHTSAQLTTGLGVARFALFVSWLVFLLEAALATSFLAPANSQMARFGDALLVLFLVVVYAVASVVTFGWVLAILGLAQLHDRRGEVRLAYLAAIVVIWLGATPWGSLVAAL